jgi:hypothetical protein
MKRVIVSLHLILVFTAVVFAQDEGRFVVAGLKDRETEEFFASFKEAVAKGEKRTVATMVSYPIRVTVKSGRRMRLSNAASFIKATR